MLASRPTIAGAENQSYYGGTARTPARAIIKGRSGLQENALRHGAMTVGKAKNLVQTPYRSKNEQLPGKHILATQPSRPLLDKTPFPNRLGGQSTNLKTPFQKQPSLQFSKILLLDNSTLLQPGGTNTPDSALRPSSTRRNARTPRSANKNIVTFETPLTTGNHWDVGDISFGQAGADGQVKEEVESPDYDEIEYMPPKLPEQPYVPPFDFEMPNYRELGTALTQAMRTYPIEEVSVPEIQPVVELAESIELSLPELADDDSFAALQLQTVPQKPTTPKAASSATRGVLRTRAVSSITLPSNPTSMTRANSTRTTTTGVTRSRAATSVARPTPASRVGVTPKVVPSRPASAKPVTTSMTYAPRHQASSSIATPALRRPATSASTYKPAGGAHVKPAASRTPSTLVRGPSRVKGVSQAAKKEDCDIIQFDTQFVQEDFRFDV